MPARRRSPWQGCRRAHERGVAGKAETNNAFLLLSHSGSRKEVKGNRGPRFGHFPLSRAAEQLFLRPNGVARRASRTRQKLGDFSALATGRICCTNAAAPRRLGGHPQVACARLWRGILYVRSRMRSASAALAMLPDQQGHNVAEMQETVFDGGHTVRRSFRAYLAAPGNSCCVLLSSAMPYTRNRRTAIVRHPLS